jgi:hypothetical protein
MKLNRRSAIGAMIGGASTAPQVAKKFKSEIMNAEIMNEESKFQNSLFKGETDYPKEISPEGIFKMEVDKYNQHLKYLNKLSTGDFSDCWEGKQINDYIDEYKISARITHINSLKSVSQVNKERIEYEKRIEQMKTRWIEGAIEQLKNLVYPTRRK